MIVSLETCLKELIENSLDSGATRIEVALGESGTEWVSIADNGSGIDCEDLSSVCRRHHTSKLEKFEDLSTTLQTFGFRGEALAAVCALSESFEIVSRTDLDETGTRCTYNRFGEIEKRISQSLPTCGTTIKVTRLFSNVPVRREDFKRNFRQRLMEAVKLVQQFAISHWDVKFVVSNEKLSAKGKIGKTELLRSDGKHESLKAAAVRICGEALRNTLELDLRPVSELTGEDEKFYRLHGIISTGGGGRSQKSLQYWFVNRRPAEVPKKLGKVINDVFKTHNSRLYPVFILNFDVPQCDIDVNVTPDKRTIFLQHEEMVLNFLFSSENLLA